MSTPAGRDARRVPRVVVVGDVVLDRDVEGRSDRLAPDAPVPVVDVLGTLESPGGAGLTALLAAASGVRVTLVAPLADDDGGRALAEALRREVDLVALPAVGATRAKVRVRAGGQSLVRVDEGGPGAPAEVPVAEVHEALAAADVVLVSDYGAGVTSDPDLRALLAEAARRVPLVWDPHPRGGAPVAGALLVTPNVAEAASAAARLAAERGGEGAASGTPDALAATLRDAWRARAVCVTAGSDGAYLVAAGAEALFVPAPAVSGGDPCGAGDRFAATAAAALARGALLSEAVTQAVQEASAWVADGGADGYRRRVGVGGRGATGVVARAGGADPPAPSAAPGGAKPSAAPGGAKPVIDGHDEVAALAARLRAGGRTLVATGGCFDIVHAGHVATLQAARRMGDALVVLLNSDASVRRLKGPGRPVVAATDRARVLAAFDCVDAVVVFEEDDPGPVLELLRPDVWAKGGDYGAEPLPESVVVRRHGGRVVLLPYLGGRSTTSIIERSGAARARPA